MASVEETGRVLRANMGAEGADVLREFMQAVRDDLEALAEALDSETSASGVEDALNTKD